ncbi:MAG: response regulator transcription factor [Deltaproteobacteria bacterium]|nr:response regulator transcription factor [Deltaproteobacteria bacterium]
MVSGNRKDKAMHKERQTRVLVVEDELAQLELITRRLQALELEVLPCSDSKEALKALLDQRFDLLVTDLQMAPMDGLELLRVVRMLEYKLPVIVITGYASKRNAIEALNLGANRMLEKPFATAQLEEMVQEVLGETMQAAQPASSENRSVRLASFLETLPISRREREILTKLVQGMTNREIADSLVISERTVKNHLVNIYQKLEVENRSQLFNMILHGI